MDRKQNVSKPVNSREAGQQQLTANLKARTQQQKRSTSKNRGSGNGNGGQSKKVSGSQGVKRGQQAMLVNKIASQPQGKKQDVETTAKKEPKNQFASIGEGLDVCSEAVITFRHGARLDINAESDQEVNEYGGKSEFDTPLCKLGHEQAHKTGQLLKEMILQMKVKRPIIIKLWCSPYLRCIQTAAGVIESFNQLINQKNVTINITEYLAEAQMSGSYNDECKMEGLTVNQATNLGEEQEAFLNERVYKFLPEQRTKFEIRYPVRWKSEKASEETFPEFSSFTFDYPEGGPNAAFPKNVNASNLRYHQFYHHFINASPSDPPIYPPQDPIYPALTLHLCSTHGNASSENLLTFYKKMYAYTSQGTFDFYSQPFSKYFINGIGYCSLSIHGRLLPEVGNKKQNADAASFNFLKEEQLVDGWVELMACDATHVAWGKAEYQIEEEDPQADADQQM